MGGVSAAYSSVIDRVDSLLGPLAAEELGYAGRVLATARRLSTRERDATDKLLPEAEDRALRLELGRLVEYLGRRQARAIPCATLGRMALADLSADLGALRQAARECDEKLLAFGV